MLMMHWREPRRRLINAQDALRTARCDLTLKSGTPQLWSLAAILAALAWMSIYGLAGVFRWATATRHRCVLRLMRRRPGSPSLARAKDRYK
ncbi:hypothetical protein RAD15_24685 [Bradyrhizobium sp. 14AA]